MFRDADAFTSPTFFASFKIKFSRFRSIINLLIHSNSYQFLNHNTGRLEHTFSYYGESEYRVNYDFSDKPVVHNSLIYGFVETEGDKSVNEGVGKERPFNK